MTDFDNFCTKLTEMNASPHSTKLSSKHYVTRWDKCNLSEYYDVSRVCIVNVTFNSEYARCTNNNDRHAITTHYSQIVEALVAVTKLSVPRIQSNSLRPF